MDVKNIHWCLAMLYLWLFGPGYFDGNTEAVLTWVWNADPDGPRKVLVTVMQTHGGDAALTQQRQANGYTGGYKAVAPRDLLAALKDAGVTDEPPDDLKAKIPELAQ